MTARPTPRSRRAGLGPFSFPRRAKLASISSISALVFTCATTAALVAQTTPEVSPDLMTSRYLALVTEYQSGDASRAVATLATWPVLDSFAVRPRTPWPPDVLRAAALLETEAAFASGVTFEDLGTRLNRADRWLTESERRLPREAGDNFRRKWDYTVGRRLLWNGLVAVAARILEQASRRFPEDGNLQLALGTAIEALAYDYGVDPAAPGNAASAARRRTQDALVRARFAFEKATAAKDGPVEARLRLAHLLVLEGNDVRATSLLESVLGAPGSAPQVAYLAAIMLGEIRARRGDVPGAIALFTDARARVPSGQSAYLAQAHVLRKAGETEAAAAVVEEMLRRPRPTTDPWRQYLLGFYEEAPPFEPLRVEVRSR
jgi:tetratricopeptide (TPR) repeat protein